MGYLEPLDTACGVLNLDPGNWRVNWVTFKNKRSGLARGMGGKYTTLSNTGRKIHKMTG